MKAWIVGVVATLSLAVASPNGVANPLSNPLLSPASQTSNQPLLSQMVDADTSLSNCRPKGLIDDARCDYETVERDVNSSNFFQTLSGLVKEKYFRFYKVDLYKDCPFWNENSLCMSRDCTVSKVDEIPIEYQAAYLSSLKVTDEADVLPQQADDTCQCAETDFCHWEDEEWSPESSWVDLIENPERFTGYSGPGAQKVWRSIYEENCFGIARPGISSLQTLDNSMQGSGLESTMQESRRAAEAFSSLLTMQSKTLGAASPSSDQCLEKRVFYKIISGLHASISIHICHDYLDQRTGEWKPNLQCFVERIAQHPDRLQNVYFNHVVLTRALSKLAERLGMTRNESGYRRNRTRPGADVLARLAPGLPTSPSASEDMLGKLLQQSLDSPPTFDEASMFDKTNPESEFLRREFRDRFRNVSRIMDCVGCDKCRLWGKLQVNGLGTALKILFEGSHLKQDRLLQRSELVALINTVHRVSESIRAVEAFREMYEAQQQSQQKLAASLNANRMTARNRELEAKNGSYSSSLHSPSSSLLDLAIRQAKSVAQRGKIACQNQWRKCLSWGLSLIRSQGEGSSKHKTEL